MTTHETYLPGNYVRRETIEAAEDPEAGPWSFGGVAVAAGDVLYTNDDPPQPVLMTAEELERAEYARQSANLTVDHPSYDGGSPPVRDTVGSNEQFGYSSSKRAVVYDALTHDQEIAAGVHGGSYDVSIHANFEPGPTDPETGIPIATDITFYDLSVVTNGMSASNTAQWGGSAEVVAWAHGDGFDDALGELEAADGVEFSQVTYDDSDTGKLDKSALPSEGFESHFLLVGETKSDSSFPVVDSSGTLRRGNVDSAWNLRGQIPDSVSREDFETYLQTLAGNFDDLELEASAESTASLFHRLGSRLGLTADASGTAQETIPAESGADADDPDPDMDRETYITTLTDEHDFPESMFEGMTDEHLERMHDVVVETSPAAPGVDDGESEGTETETETEIGGEAGGEAEASAEGYMTRDEVKELLASERAAASKAEQIDEIIAYDEDYDEDDREELMASSPAVIEKTHKKTTTSHAGPMPGVGGKRGEVEASIGDDEDDLDAYGTGVQ